MENQKNTMKGRKVRPQSMRFQDADRPRKICSHITAEIFKEKDLRLTSYLTKISA